MASTINASSSSGIVTTADTSAILQLQTAGTTALTVDTSANVGIGTASPSNRLHVVSAAGTVQVKWSDATNGTANLDTASGLSRMWTNVGLAFGTGAETYTERMRIDSSGNLLVGITAPTFSASTRKSIEINGSTDSFITFGAGGSAIGYLYAAASEARLFSFANVPLTFGTNNTERARIDSSGNLLVGLTTAIGVGVNSSSNFIVGSSGSYWKTTNFSATYYFAYNGVDKAAINGSTGAYTALSDVNKKKDFEASAIGLETVMQLQPKLFRMLDDADDAPKQLGFIAQEVQPFIPQAYSEQDGPDGQKFIGLQDRPIIAALTKAIQEMKAIIDTQAERIAVLEAK